MHSTDDDRLGIENLRVAAEQNRSCSRSTCNFEITWRGGGPRDVRGLGKLRITTTRNCEVEGVCLRAYESETFGDLAVGAAAVDDLCCVGADE